MPIPSLNLIRYSIISAVILANCSVAQAGGLPKVKISLYAPNNNGAPLYIMSFNYSHGAIGVIVRNDSDKTVTGFRIGGVVTVPIGCSRREREPEESSIQTGSGLKNLRVDPHQTAMSLRSDPPFDPPGLIFAARDEKAAYINVGVGIGEVTFADGTAWHHRGDAASEIRSPGEINGRGMDACNSEDVSTATDALERIVRVAFKADPALQVAGNFRVPMPRLTFSCILIGDTATCPEKH